MRTSLRSSTTIPYNNGVVCSYYAILSGYGGWLNLPLDDSHPNSRIPMAKILVLYFSSYGHVETMAKAVAEGARSAGASVDIKRVPEPAPVEMAKAAHSKQNHSGPVATIYEKENYDATIDGTPLRFGRIL